MEKMNYAITSKIMEKVKENRIFADYESAKQQCDRWNEEGYGI